MIPERVLRIDFPSSALKDKKMPEESEDRSEGLWGPTRERYTDESQGGVGVCDEFLRTDYYFRCFGTSLLWHFIFQNVLCFYL